MSLYASKFEVVLKIESTHIPFPFKSRRHGLNSLPGSGRTPSKFGSDLQGKLFREQEAFEA